MIRSTIVRSILPVALLTALSAIPAAGTLFAADDAARPHHNNDNSQARTHNGQHDCKHSTKHRYGRDGNAPEAQLQTFRERMEKLSLSDVQKQDMAALIGIYQPRFKSLRERGQADREALFEAPPDAANYSLLVNTVSNEAGQTASEMVVLLTELQANAYALLTAAQQAEYRDLKAKARQRADTIREQAKQRARTRKASSDKDY